MAEEVITLREAVPRRVARASLRAWKVTRQLPVIPVVVMAAFIFVAIFAPQLAPHNPIRQDLSLRNAPPVWAEGGSGDRMLGGDHVGRDVLSRVIYGARISLMVAGVSLVAGAGFGTLLGVLAGYVGGILDELLMRLVDVYLALPFIFIALVVAMTIGTSLAVVMAIIALVAWSQFVRNVRAEVLTLKERDYVALARVAGASPLRIIYQHILPNFINTVIVLATLRVGQLILAEATISFLGAGIPAPTPAWGLMVAEGREYVNTAWWTSFFPGMAIFLVVMSLNFLGDWVRDRLDPRLRQL
jgi:peptide/nickel transport system permease protein